MRSFLVLALMAAATPAFAHGGGQVDAHATEELSELYQGMTEALLDESPGRARPVVRYRLPGATLSNQDPFSHAIATALAAHHDEEQGGDHDDASPTRRGLGAWLKAVPGKLTQLTLRLSADAWQGAKEYGPVYAVYTGASEVVEHAAAVAFPPLMLFEFNLVTQPLFFAIAKPAMTATSIATHTGSSVPLLARLRSIPKTTKALMLKGGASAFEVTTGRTLTRKDVRATHGAAEAPVAHVARSPFWAEAHLAMTHDEPGAVHAAPKSLDGYVGEIFGEASYAARLGRVARLDSGFSMLRDSLGELVGASFADKQLSTRQFFQHKAALGKLGRLSRTLTATLATYAAGATADHAPAATSLVKQLAGLWKDAHVLARGDRPDQLAALEAGIKTTATSLKAFRRRGPAGLIGRAAR